MATFKNFTVSNRKYHFVPEVESRITLEHENAEYRYILPSLFPSVVWATNDSYHWRTCVKAFHIFKAELIDRLDRAEYMAEKNRRKSRSWKIAKLLTTLDEYHEITIPSITAESGLTYLDVRCIVVNSDTKRGITHLTIVPFDYSGVVGIPTNFI